MDRGGNSMNPERYPRTSMELEPSEGPYPWNGEGTEGWVAPAATVKRKVASIEDSRGPVMYHSTMPKHRKSIDQTGLLTSHSQDENEFLPRGVYMTPTEPEKGHWGDIWSIDTSKLQHLEPDEEGQHQELSGGSYWTKHDVPRDAMQLHYQADPAPDMSRLHQRRHTGVRVLHEWLFRSRTSCPPT